MDVHDTDYHIWLTFFESISILLDRYEDVLIRNDYEEGISMAGAFGRYAETMIYIMELKQDRGNLDYTDLGQHEEWEVIRSLARHLLNLRSSMLGHVGIRHCTELAHIGPLGAREREVPNGAGQPKFKVDVEQVTYLHRQGFSLTSIAVMLNISRTTLWRHLRNTGTDIARYTEISDNELRNCIQNIYSSHVHCGVIMMLGHLKSRGIVIQRRKVRAIMHEIDPANSALRWSLTVRRRVYSVPTSNALWHIDTHHALIRWRMVTAGGIDGYSRVIVFLGISDNNRSDTVLHFFENAVASYGCPSRVRGDCGTENVGVRDFMEHVRGTGRGSFIAGRSTHNSRIERCWRDVMYAVIQTYYSLFYFLESVEDLNPDNEDDLFCLHIVYLPIINRSLTEFKNAYNNHRLSTERGWTPQQLWTNSMINARNSVAEHVNEVLTGQNLENFGIDPDAPTPEDVRTEGVYVPETANPLSDMEMAHARNIIVNTPIDGDFSIKLRMYVQSRHDENGL